MFADFKDFVHLTETLDPASLIEELNQNFAHFDQIVEGNHRRLEAQRSLHAYQLGEGPAGGRGGQGQGRS